MNSTRVSEPSQSIQDGQPPKVAQHLLPAPQVQVPQEVQGDSVQEVRWVQASSGQKEVLKNTTKWSDYYNFDPFSQIWPQAAGIRRSVQTHPEEEGQDHQEAGPQAGVHWVPVEEPGNSAKSGESTNTLLSQHNNC